MSVTGQKTSSPLLILSRPSFLVAVEGLGGMLRKEYWVACAVFSTHWSQRSPVKLTGLVTVAQIALLHRKQKPLKPLLLSCRGVDAKQLLNKVGYNGTVVYLGGGTDEIKIVAFDLIAAQKQ